MMGGTGSGGSSRTTPSRASSDREAIDAANKANSKIAKTTPALKSDLSRSVSAKPMGASVGVNFPTGGKISGAIKSLQAPAAPLNQNVGRKVTVPAATISTNQPLSPSAARIAMGDVAPTPSIYKTVAEADRAIVAKATQTYNQRFGTNYTPDQYSRLAKTVAGEAAGESDFARAAVANTFGNRVALAQQEGSPYGYMGGGDFASLANQYDAYRMQNTPYRAAVPGTKTYQQGVNAMYQTMNPQSTFSRTASPKVLTSTHYYNPAEVRREPDWAMDKTKFERIDSHLFGTAEASPKTVAKARAAQLASAEARIVPTSSTPERAFVPGLIKYPDLARPPSVGRSAVVPTKDMRAQEAARLRGLMESYQQPPGYGKKFVDRIVPEDTTIRDMMKEIAAESPSYFLQGAPNERMLYNTSPKTLDRMKQVFDRSRGMSFTPDIPKQLDGMSFTGSPGQMFAGSESPYRPYDIRSPEFGISAIPTPSSMKVLPDAQGPPRPIGGMSFTGMQRQNNTSPPETTSNIARASFSTLNPTVNETMLRGAYKEKISPEERLAMDALYEEQMGEKPPNAVDGSDVYGPEYVDPEIQELMREQEKLNKTGIEGMKRVPGFGALVSAGDALTKLFTGKTIAGGSADLKRAYMQASDEGKAALEDKYPNLTKFASDAGLTPKRDMSNYTNWAEKSGLRVAPDRRGGGENSGIRSLTRQPKGDETTTPEPEAPSTSSGSRPDIYYMWDLGVNVPSPGDPNYNQYQTYLAERLAAQRAMGYV
jgi:spore germination cell wall hydrolase CwlJ-like protein